MGKDISWNHHLRNKKLSIKLLLWLSYLHPDIVHGEAHTDGEFTPPGSGHGDRFPELHTETEWGPDTQERHIGEVQNVVEVPEPQPCTEVPEKPLKEPGQRKGEETDSEIILKSFS